MLPLNVCPVVEVVTGGVATPFSGRACCQSWLNIPRLFVEDGAVWRCQQRERGVLGRSAMMNLHRLSEPNRRCADKNFFLPFKKNHSDTRMTACTFHHSAAPFSGTDIQRKRCFLLGFVSFLAKLGCSWDVQVADRQSALPLPLLFIYAFNLQTHTALNLDRLLLQ